MFVTKLVRSFKGGEVSVSKAWMATKNWVFNISSFLEHIYLTRVSETRSLTDKRNIAVFITITKREHNLRYTALLAIIVRFRFTLSVNLSGLAFFSWMIPTNDQLHGSFY